MTRLLLIACLLVVDQSQAGANQAGKVLFDFADPAAMRGWQIEDDGVMGYQAATVAPP
jgi:hypothetical protein